MFRWCALSSPSHSPMQKVSSWAELSKITNSKIDLKEIVIFQPKLFKRVLKKSKNLPYDHVCTLNFILINQMIEISPI